MLAERRFKKKRKLRTPQDKDAYFIAHTKNYKIEKMGNQLINSKEKHWRIRFEMAT
jgi:hypothetical protein